MHHLAISNDITLALTPAVSLHFYTGVQGFVPGGVALDLPVPMYWPPGFALGTNKLTVAVLHKGMPVVLDGHDCGTMIAHVQCVPDPANAFSPIHICFSSRKVNFFSASRVFEGKCIGISKLLAWPPAPMTSCGEPISLPGTGVPTTVLNSAVVDFGWVDALIGWGTVCAMLAFECAIAPLKAPANPWKTMMMNKIGIGPRSLGKQGIATLSGATRTATTDGPAGIAFAVGSPYLRAGYGVSRDKKGNFSAAMNWNVATRSGELGRDQGSRYSKMEERTYNDVIKVKQRPGQNADSSYHKLADRPDSWGKPLETGL